MNVVTELPQQYEKVRSVDPQQDKKLFLMINGVGLVVFVLLAIYGNLFVPITTMFYPKNMLIMLVGTVVYAILHELIHGWGMKCFGSKTVCYGFTGLYAYAGCKDYFAKRPYIIIALAPVVGLGVVLLGLNMVVGSELFWGVYFIQIGNLSGSAGDLYMMLLLCRMPKDLLVQDTGVSMAIYCVSEK